METELETFLNKCEKSKLQLYVDSHPDCFTEALQLIIEEHSPVVWRAAWLISLSMHPNDLRIQKHINQLIGLLPHRGESEQRELMKILFKMEVDENIEGLLFDHCVMIWLSVHKQTSVRIIALKIICKITKRQPELIDELKVLTQSQYLQKISIPLRNTISRLTAPLLKTEIK